MEGCDVSQVAARTETKLHDCLRLEIDRIQKLRQKSRSFVAVIGIVVACEDVVARALLDLLADPRPVSFGIVGHAFFIIAVPKNIRNPFTQMVSLRCRVCEVPMTQSWYVGAAALVVKHRPQVPAGTASAVKFCLERGIVTAANVFDHVEPHKGAAIGIRRVPTRHPIVAQLGWRRYLEPRWFFAGSAKSTT